MSQRASVTRTTQPKSIPPNKTTSNRAESQSSNTKPTPKEALPQHLSAAVSKKSQGASAGLPTHTTQPKSATPNKITSNRAESQSSNTKSILKEALPQPDGKVSAAVSNFKGSQSTRLQIVDEPIGGKNEMDLHQLNDQSIVSAIQTMVSAIQNLSVIMQNVKEEMKDGFKKLGAKLDAKQTALSKLSQKRATGLVAREFSTKVVAKMTPAKLPGVFGALQGLDGIELESFEWQDADENAHANELLEMFERNWALLGARLGSNERAHFKEFKLFNVKNCKGLLSYKEDDEDEKPLSGSFDALATTDLYPFETAAGGAIAVSAFAIEWKSPQKIQHAWAQAVGYFVSMHAMKQEFLADDQLGVSEVPPDSVVRPPLLLLTDLQNHYRLFFCTFSDQGVKPRMWEAQVDAKTAYAVLLANAGMVARPVMINANVGSSGSAGSSSGHRGGIGDSHPKDSGGSPSTGGGGASSSAAASGSGGAGAGGGGSIGTSSAPPPSESGCAPASSLQLQGSIVTGTAAGSLTGEPTHTRNALARLQMNTAVEPIVKGRKETVGDSRPRIRITELDGVQRLKDLYEGDPWGLMLAYNEYFYKNFDEVGLDIRLPSDE